MACLRGGFLEDESSRSTNEDESEVSSDEGMEDDEFPGSDGSEAHMMSEVEDMSEDESEAEEDEDYDENEEWPWVKGFKTHVKRQIDGKDEGIGWCSGRLIDPDKIRHDFYREMEEPSQDLANLAFTLFDRWGCLKEDFQKHPIKRGSGVWGEELQNAHFLVFETISVDPRFRHQGIARGMVEELWTKATLGDPECKFAFAWATELPTREASDRREKLNTVEKSLDVEKGQVEVETFLRAIGFRRVGSSDWFCLAKDTAHPSRGIAPEKDYSPPHLYLWTEAVEFCKELSVLDDDASKAYMMARAQQRDPYQDPIWTMPGYHNNTVLHVAFKPSQSNQIIISQQQSHFGPVPQNKVTKTDTLMWLLSQPFTDSLLSAVNQYGETPLEAYQSYLEKQRVCTEAGGMMAHVSDNFRGYTMGEVTCLLKFQGRPVATDHEISCARFGCTCGSCEEGFLSSRMLFAMECQADCIGDMSREEIEFYSSGADWVESHRDLWLKFVEPSVLQNMTTNKSIRRGFARMFHHVATCCRQRQAPITPNVMAVVEDENEWPPNTRNFLQRGGTVASVVQAVFEAVENADKYLGDGDHDEVFEKEIAARKPCRNDREVVFACRQFMRLEHGEGF